MKKKWKFLILNDWDIWYDEFNVEILAINWQKDFKYITIFGFSFIWEK